MDHANQIELLRVETDALCAVRPLSAAVASCPGWSVADVLRHIGGVHRWMIQQLRADDPTELRRDPVEHAPTADRLADWVRDGAALLVDELTHDPDRACPTLHGPGTARWWTRRALFETLVHRWDAQAAVGAVSPIDPAVAVDGIDEVLTEVAPLRLDRSRFAADATLHLHATDVAGEWIIDVGPERYGVRHGHEKGDVAARGPAADLFLLAWARIPAARLEVFGQAELLDRWHDAADF